MIFFSNFKACLKEKRGRGVFPPFFFFPKLMVCFSRIFCGFWYVFPGYFAGMIFRCHIWRSKKNMKMHALLDEQKRTCSMRHWSYDVTTKRKSLWSKSPPEIENCSVCFEIKPTNFDNNFEKHNRHVTQATKQPTKQPTKRLKTNFVWGIGPSWWCEICWLVVHRCFISNDVQSETA